MSNTVLHEDRWKEYEPFDRNGLQEWTDVFDCDEDDCENRVAVYDPYGTCQIVLCAEHNGGVAAAGPIDFPFPESCYDDCWERWEAETGRDIDREVEEEERRSYRRYCLGQKIAKVWVGTAIGFGLIAARRTR